MDEMLTEQCLQIQPNQFPVYIFLNSRRFLRDKPYNISDPVYLQTSYFLVLADTYKAGMLTHEIIVILFTRGLPMYSVLKIA